MSSFINLYITFQANGTIDIHANVPISKQFEAVSIIGVKKLAIIRKPGCLCVEISSASAYWVRHFELLTIKSGDRVRNFDADEISADSIDILDRLAFLGDDFFE